MRKKRYILSVLVALSTIFLCTYLFLPSVISRLAVERLKRAGFSEVQFELVFPGVRSAVISSVTLKGELSGYRVNARLKRLAVSYDLLDLRKRRLNRAELKEGLLELVPAARGRPPAAVSPLDGANFLRLLTELPFRELVLENVALALPGVSDLISISGSIRTGEPVEIRADLTDGVYLLSLEGFVSPTSGAFSFEGRVLSNAKLVTGFQIKGKVEGDSLKGELELQKPALGSFAKGTFHHRFSDGRGETRAEGLLRAANALNHVTEALGGAGKLPLAITSGDATFSAGANWGSSKTAPPWAELRLRELEGAVAGVTVRGVSGSGRFLVTPHGVESPGIKLNAKEIALPVPLTDAEAEIAFQPRRLTLKSGSAAVLDGRLSFGAAEYVHGKKKWSLRVSLEGVSLQRLLEVYPQERVSGEGTLNSEFVLQHDDEGIRIKGGTISSKTGGVLRVMSGAQGETANPSLAAASDALKNFHYEQLRADIDFSPRGTLVLKLFLSGNNPQWQSGKKVEFNITLEESMYELLRSIRLTKGIEESVTESVNRGMRK